MIGTRATRSPYEIERPVGAWRTTPCRAAHSAAATPHWPAAASTSISRAGAPARDRVSKDELTLWLPTVCMRPNFGSLTG